MINMVRKRSVQAIIEFCGWDMLVDYAKRARSLRDASIIATLFLTGGRVSEVITLTKDDFDLSQPEVIVVKRMFVLKRFRKTGEFVVEGQTRWTTEKIKAYRSFAILENDPLSPYLLAYLKTLKKGEMLFPITRVRVYQIVRELTGQYPHWFRSQRACQLADEHDLDLNSLMSFFQWRDQKTAMRYTSMGWRGLARRQGAKV